MPRILLSLGLVALLLSACSSQPTTDSDPGSSKFTIAVIPDTQNYLDYTHQTTEGYQILAASSIPFGVAPGNHDYDAMWSAGGYRFLHITLPIPTASARPRDWVMAGIG